MDLFAPDRLRRIAHVAVAVSLAALAWRLWGQTRIGLTDGIDRPFGDDFVNFWSGARLALLGRAAEVYDLDRFHAFQVATVGGAIDPYVYSYAPSMMLLSLPFALVPYVPGWVLWTFGGWLAFAWVVRAAWPGARRGDAWLYAAAIPAVLVNAASGQNGSWTASLLGGGLVLLERRPLLAGVLLGLLAAKPQLAVLVPLALLVARSWIALAGFVAGALAPMLAALALFGTAPLLLFMQRMDFMRRVTLEDGTGVWHRMCSVFVMIRHLPAPLWAAYAAQGVMALACAAAVVLAWRAPAAPPLKHAVLLAAVPLFSPYMQDYDLVSAALVPLFLLQGGVPWRPPVLLVSALLILAPLIIAPVAATLGLSVGGLILVAGLAMSASQALRPPTPAACPGRRRTSCPPPG